jgi:methionine aminopeptidase
MISIKNKAAIQKMVEAGKRLSAIFSLLPSMITPGRSTLDIDRWIEDMLIKQGLSSRMKVYRLMMW